MCFSSTGRSLSGVTIGDGDVIGACSLVAHDVPPYAIASGHPCRSSGCDSVLRMWRRYSRFAGGIRWWNWPRDVVVVVVVVL